MHLRLKESGNDLQPDSSLFVEDHGFKVSSLALKNGEGDDGDDDDAGLVFLRTDIRLEILLRDPSKSEGLAASHDNSSSASDRDTVMCVQIPQDARLMDLKTLIRDKVDPWLSPESFHLFLNGKPLAHDYNKNMLDCGIHHNSRLELVRAEVTQTAGTMGLSLPSTTGAATLEGGQEYEDPSDTMPLVSDNTNATKQGDLSMSASPSRGGRSLDCFLEDAYREHDSMFSVCHQWKYWMIMLSLGISNSSDASEILCLSYILSDSTFADSMLLDSDWRGGLLAAAVFAGMLVGGLFVGTLGDWKGRRPMLIFGLLLNMTAGILSCFAPNVFVLTGIRTIAGVGIGATVPPLFTLVAELAPPSNRGFCVTFCASFWMVGSVFVAVAAIYFLKKDDNDTAFDTTNDSDRFWVAWRSFALACAVPSALGAAMVHWLVPESPRFLALQGRFDEAAASANLLGSSLQCNSPNLHRWELEEQFGESSHSASNNHPSEGSSGTTTARWIRMAMLDFFVSAGKLYTPSLRQTTWPLQMVWFSLSFGSYGLMTWINTLFFAIHLEDVYFNALLFALSNLPGNLFTAFFMDRAGRAQLLVGSILSASLSLLSFAAFANASDQTHPPSTYGVVLSACSFQCFTVAAWNTIDVMTSELFPTTVRSTGMGVCAASGRIGAMLAQFVNGSLVGRPVRLLVVASITLAMGAMTPFLLPQRGDMTGQPVQDDYGKTISSRKDSESTLELSGEDPPCADSNSSGKDRVQAPPSSSDSCLSRRERVSQPVGLKSYQRVSGEPQW